MFKFIRKFLRIKELDGLDLESADRIEKHRNIVLSKPMTKKVFHSFFYEIKKMDQKHFNEPGPRIEIGSGAYPIKEVLNNVLSSDFIYSEHLDKVLDAENMNLPPNSVGAFYAQNVFHHFKNPKKFFFEIERCLLPGGGAIIIEPYYGFLASLIYKNLSDNEYFDKNQICWNNNNKGHMYGANQALSYLIFKRDREKFEKDFPTLKIVETKLSQNFLLYLISGGLNFKQLLPSSFTKLIYICQFICYPLLKFFALHHFIVIKKINRNNQ